MNPLRIDRGVKALSMTPTRLFVGGVLVGGAEANAHDVVRSKKLFDRLRDGGL